MKPQILNRVMEAEVKKAMAFDEYQKGYKDGYDQGKAEGDYEGYQRAKKKYRSKDFYEPLEEEEL